MHVRHTFLYISLSFLHDYNVKMLNFVFYEERKQATTKFSSLSELGYGPLEFNFRRGRLHLTKLVGRNNCDKDWENANSLFSHVLVAVPSRHVVLKSLSWIIEAANQLVGLGIQSSGTFESLSDHYRDFFFFGQFHLGGFPLAGTLNHALFMLLCLLFHVTSFQPVHERHNFTVVVYYFSRFVVKHTFFPDFRRI